MLCAVLFFFLVWFKVYVLADVIVKYFIESLLNNGTLLFLQCNHFKAYLYTILHTTICILLNIDTRFKEFLFEPRNKLRNSLAFWVIF